LHHDLRRGLGAGALQRMKHEKVYDAFPRAGGKFTIDTANIYTNGTSESFLGEFMEDHRQSVVMATKNIQTPLRVTDPKPGRKPPQEYDAGSGASLKRREDHYIDLLLGSTSGTRSRRGKR